MKDPDGRRKRQVQQFYDVISPYWLDLWGVHVHHGYWKTGDESKEAAQDQLVEELAIRAGITGKMEILDVGCGMGGSSIFLSERYHAHTIGITLSPVQADIATKTASEKNVNAQFMVMDAEHATLDGLFDVVWSIEAVSHFNNPQSFFSLASTALKPGGKIALIDWFHIDNLSKEQHDKYIEPIKKAMLAFSLTTTKRYMEHAVRHGFTIITCDDISDKVSRSWDIGMKIIAKPGLWKIALGQGRMFVTFLKGIDAMRKAFSSKTFQYCMLIASKPNS